MKASGLNTEIFSGGGTGTYNIMTKVPGYTDVQVGSYVFMDAQYLEIGNEKRGHLHGLRAVAHGHDDGAEYVFPEPHHHRRRHKGADPEQARSDRHWRAGFRYTAGSDEFGTIQYETANKTYKVGDKLELIVPHCDPVVNLYDVFYGVRNDRVEVVWPVTARGKSQ